MRYVGFVLILILIVGCNKTAKSTKPVALQDSTSIKNTKIDSITKPKRKYPYLDDTNAMDFFLNFEKNNPETTVRLTTTMGDIDIKLHTKTKFHRANFIFLTKQKAFDNTQFHRVVKNFIIQGGNTDDISVAQRRHEIGHYLLPTDTKRGYKHKRGVISMPSSDIENPHKMASPYEFFITQKDSYHLDGDYTIFGEVIKGMDVVDKINKVKVDQSEWPYTNIYIEKVRILE